MNVMPPFVDAPFQTTFPVCVSVISTLTEITLAVELEERTSPYSLTTPEIMALTFSAPASLTISSEEGAVGLAMPARMIPFETSPDWQNIHIARVARSIEEKTSRTRSAAWLSWVKFANGMTATVFMEAKSMLESWNVSAP